MKAYLDQSKIISNSKLRIAGSKSESNRLLLLQKLYPEIVIENLSSADDTKLMSRALSSNSDVIDIHHAGTAMRFLTAYMAIQERRKVTLTGSSRMQERPIQVLVNALRDLGADIEYKNKNGFPPLIINGKKLTASKIEMSADVSSQYISALLLIGSKLENGLELKLKGEIASVPYIKMTLTLLNTLGINTSFIDNVIKVLPFSGELESKVLNVESDWSSASYFYSCLALSDIGTQISLSTYNLPSLQGDAALMELYKNFGIETQLSGNSLVLKKIAQNTETKYFDLVNTPDLAQTIAVTCLGLGIECHLTGLHTLKIKETDRLFALKTEIEKCNGSVQITNDSITLKSKSKPNENIAIDTYHDHRMAMAFAPLALKVPIQINEAEVVSKSYPDFWTDLQHIGFKIRQE